MKAEDMLTLLDLDAPVDGPAPVIQKEIIDGLTPGEKPPPAKIDTVLDLDKWSHRRGEELMAESAEMQEVTKLAEKLADTAAGVTASDEQKYWNKAAADFHAAAYEPQPLRGPGCKDGLRDDFMQALMETAEFEQIRQSTVLNPLAAEVATLAFTKQFAERREEAARVAAAGPQPAPGPNGKRKGKSDPAADAEIATMKAAAKACAAALQDVQDATDAGEMCGVGGGGAGKRLDMGRLAAIHRRVRSSARLKKIAALAGRFRRLAASKQRQKVGHGQDEVVGVTVGDRIDRLIPAELAVLCDEDAWLDTARRLLEGQAMVRQVRASEPAGKGPIVVCVDESGSMDGDRIETAKGLSLALAWIARKQKRWCALVGFSGNREGTFCLLPPGKPNEQELLGWLEHFYSGGTVMDVPLAVLPEQWSRFVAAGMGRGKTDMIVITDAEVAVPQPLRDSFLAFKHAEKVRLTTLVIDGKAGDMAAVSDEVYTLAALTLESQAVGAVLSV